LEKINWNFGIVLNPSGTIYGGAQKRFTNLFQHIYNSYPDNIYYFVSKELFKQIKQLFPSFNFDNVIILKDLGFNESNHSVISLYNKAAFNKKDPLSENSTINSDENTSTLNKIVFYFKHYLKQYYLYRQLEKSRKEHDIKVFMGVYNGILPLYFYLNKKKRKAGIIFSDMDSWFSNIHDGNRNNWYKKYDSFNYGLENSDRIDFLSPFIADGILKKAIKLDKRSISISPCSFSDYTKCTPGDKKDFLVSFAARIFPDKNPMLYLEAAKIILSKNPHVKFILMGEGVPILHEGIKNFININKLNDSITFCFHPNPPEIFSESTIFVSIQTTNNYPSQSVLEAMACGNAIIASDVGDTRMFVNEEVGILIPLELDSLVNALERLINNKDQALKLGKNAREFVMRQHKIEKCSDYYLDLFEQAKIKTESQYQLNVR
jgi:glycosyltransferase involved in cell wall biosynthesis